MKKPLLLLAVLLLAAIAYSLGNVVKINPKDINHRDDYIGTGITRYDLGDVMCFSKSEYTLFCLKK